MEKEVKDVKKSTKGQKFYLFILEGIKNNKSIKQISEGLGVTRQRLNPYVSSLKEAGVIKKVGYGCWEILKELEVKDVKKLSRVAQIKPHKFLHLKPDTVRGHAFQFTLQLPVDFRNWDKREELLTKAGIKFKPIKIFGGGQSLDFKGRKVHLTNKSVIIYEKESFIEELASESQSKAISHFLRLVKSLERHLRANFSPYRFKVSRAHYSLIKNALARQYDDENKKLQVYNDKGLWFLIDNSFNLHELEIIQNREGPQKAVDRNEGMQQWVKQMDETNYEVTPKFILTAMNGIQQNQAVFAENMVSHVKAIQDLANAVNELKEVVKKKE